MINSQYQSWKEQLLYTGFAILPGYIPSQVTQRTLSVLLLELRRLDVDREGVLTPSLMDQQFEK